MSALDDLIAQNSAAPSAPGIDALIAKNAAVAPQAPASAAGGTGAAAVQPAAGQPNWQAPGGFIMGLGDTIKGGVQSMLHGGAYLANKIAPDSQFAKDINAAVPQVDATIANQEQAYQAARAAKQPPTLSGLITGQKPEPGIDWARIGGNAAGMVPMALAAPEAAGMSMPGRIALGTALGAQSAAFQPVTDNTRPYADQKLQQIGADALTGGIAAPVTSAVGGIISGAGDAAARRLAQAGVTMTPGQILGQAAARTEEKLSSVPILGDFIKNAQQRSVQSFNRAAYNEALGPIGQTMPHNIGTGSDGVDYVRNQIGHVYDSIVPRASLTADQNLSNDIATIRADLAQNAPGALQQFDNVVHNQITGKLAGGTVPQGGGLPIGGVMNGQQWNDTRSTIAGIARNRLAGNSTPDDRVLADSLGDLNDAINTAVGRSSPPDILPTLGRANAAYAQYKQIERAAGAAAASNNGNVFTAAQYANAVRNSATAAQRGTNSGLNGQFAADATNVLGSKYPDSGTPGRAALMATLAALGGHAALPASVAVPATVAGTAAALPYTALGQRVAQTLLMSRPAGAAQVGQAIGNYGVPLSAALGAALINGANR